MGNHACYSYIYVGEKVCFGAHCASFQTVLSLSVLECAKRNEVGVFGVCVPLKTL